MTQAYYRKTPQQALEAQNATAEGLSAQEARRRAEQYGPNKLSEGKKKSTLQVFLEQFKDLMVLILIIAAVISAFSGNVESTIVIFAVLVLNAILGTVQYEKAEKSLESLKAMASPTAKVMRGGVRVEIPSADVVPGDIVLLEAGDMVVADGRVLENFSPRSTSPPSPARARAWTRRPRPSMPTRWPWATRRTWCSPAPW